MSKTLYLLLGLGVASCFSAAQAEPLPRPTASFFGKAEILDERSRPIEIEVRASGPKLRYDLPASAVDDDHPMAMVLDYATGQVFMFPVGDRVSHDDRVAMQFSMASGQIQQNFCNHGSFA